MKANASLHVDELEYPPSRAVHLPLSTIAKVLLTLFALWAIYELGAVIALVLIAVVMAIALEPLVAWLEARRVARWVAATVTVFAIVACLVLFIAVCGSSLAAQSRQVLQRIGSVQRDVVDRLPPAVAKAVQGTRLWPDASSVATYAVMIGTLLVDAVVGAVVAFILTIYFLIEGRRTWQWLVAYVPQRNRARVQETADAACEAVLHYVAGNVATSVFAAITVLVALTALHVPAALLLALLAGLCDFVPVLGFIVSAVPAVLLALMVSPATAFAVAAIYVAYHLAENYVIGPKVYGGRLRLSNLAVLLAFAAGAELFGIVGALLALPVAAMYPCVEDIWLRGYLARDAADTHRKIEREERED
jgi:predicted PurR-regulated permease PerM